MRIDQTMKAAELLHAPEPVMGQHVCSLCEHLIRPSDAVTIDGRRHLMCQFRQPTENPKGLRGNHPIMQCMMAQSFGNNTQQS